MEKIVVAIEKTKRGFPAMWERGGACTNSGGARIIAKSDGSVPTAVYIPTGGHLSNGEHALIPIHIGYFVISVAKHRDDLEVFIFKVHEVRDNEAVLEQVNCYDRGEWDKDPEDFLGAAISAAIQKADCYHCRRAMYAKLKEKNLQGFSG